MMPIFMSPSGLRSLQVLKTTQSGWSHFLRDKFTTLPETDERLLATDITAVWTFHAKSSDALNAVDFSKIRERAQATILEAFFGPPDTGVFSPGVQYTLHQMAVQVLHSVSELSRVRLSLPNLHFLPCQLPVMKQNRLSFEHDIYIPSSEPHGIISATVSRDTKSKL